MSSALAPLPVERLRWRCDPAELGFETTETVPPLDSLVGQERGIGALEFGLGLGTPGYNLYVAGPAGSGRSTAVRDRVARVAAGRPAAADWCYLHNFADPAQPLALRLAPGGGAGLARDLDAFVARCAREIPQAFEAEQYQQRRAAIQQRLQDGREALLNELRAFADQIGFILQVTPMGIGGVPLLAPGQPLSAEGFELLPPEKKHEYQAKGDQLEGRVGAMFLAVHRLEREASEAMDALDRATMEGAAGQMLEPLRAKYAAESAIVRQLLAVQADLVEHLADFRQGAPEPGSLPALLRASGYDRYRVNALVSGEAGGAPVVFEPNPTYYNLLGRIDYRATLGAMSTDHTLLRPGALHRANGGFLVLQVRDVLLNPFAWDGLKRALLNRELRMENMGEQFTAIPTATLRPQPIPLDVKVVLLGDLATYLLLYQADPDFARLFRVKSQFGATMARSAEAVAAYATLVSHQAREHGLRPFGRGAVARLVEHGARLAEDQARLATRFDTLAELAVEADYQAGRAGAALVEATHVDAALAAREHRVDLPEEEVERAIDEGTLAIDTRALVPGQVNGLAVTDLGDHAFARPSRITARAGLGSGGVINIEREVELSGPTHSKGVLILRGYVLGQYARDLPLALSAQITFEQVYGAVDGDSASSAELYALLSCLADIPLRQGIAVTGSVNQRGEVQAVGAVTAKVEGFFAVCRAQGLTGEQGVIIPAANVRHLMLRQDVLDAVARGEFAIWAVRTIDEGLELLSGVPAGARRADGSYPPGTFHARVQARLAAMAHRLAKFGGPGLGPTRRKPGKARDAAAPRATAGATGRARPERARRRSARAIAGPRGSTRRA